MRRVMTLLVPMLLVSMPSLAGNRVVVFPVIPLQGEVSDAAAKEMNQAILEELRQVSELEIILGVHPTASVRSPATVRRPARSSASFSRALSMLKDGEKLIQRMRFPQAIKALRAGIAGVVKNLDLLDNYDRLIDAHVLLAVAYFRRGKQSAGTDILEAVARLRPGYRLDPQKYPPVFLGVFDDARNRALGRPRGSIVVSSAPQGASVSLNGRELGKTPILIEDVIPGENHLLVREAGGVRAEHVIVREGMESKRHFDLGGGSSTASITMAYKMAANRCDTDVRRTARRLGKKAKADYVLLTVMGRGKDLYSFGAFLGKTKSGSWIVLEPLVPDLDLLSASIEAHSLSRDMKGKIEEGIKDSAGVATLAFIVGKKVHSGSAQEKFRQSVVSFASSSRRGIAGMRRRGPVASRGRGPIVAPVVEAKPTPVTPVAKAKEPTVVAPVVLPEETKTSVRSSGRAPVAPVVAKPVAPVVVKPEPKPKPKPKPRRAPLTRDRAAREVAMRGPVVSENVGIVVAPLSKPKAKAKPKPKPKPRVKAKVQAKAQVQAKPQVQADPEPEVFDEPDEVLAAGYSGSDASSGSDSIDLHAELQYADTPFWQEWWFLPAAGSVAAVLIGGTVTYLLLRDTQPDAVNVYAEW